MSDDEELCDQCGHPSDPHLICGEVDERLGGAPTSGWRECPEPECECYATWSLSPELLAAYEEYRRSRS